MAWTSMVGFGMLLVLLGPRQIDAQEPREGMGISCGGLGRAAVQIVVPDSIANLGRAIVIGAGQAPRDWKNGHTVALWRGDERGALCSTSIGTTTIRASITADLRVTIGAADSVPVTIRSRRGRELARATFAPGSSDVTLSWNAAR